MDDHQGAFFFSFSSLSNNLTEEGLASTYHIDALGTGEHAQQLPGWACPGHHDQPNLQPDGEGFVALLMIKAHFTHDPEHGAGLRLRSSCL